MLVFGIATFFADTSNGHVVSVSTKYSFFKFFVCV